MKRRAILSVYDKTGLVELGRALSARGFELVASGGSARKLSEAGLDVRSVDSVTGHPEILGGRVKTLHPAVHGGILARRTPEHLSELVDNGINAVDVVVCNLYPFVETVRDPAVTEAEAIEQIDIGGVALLRAAAKNFESVAVLCDPSDYADFVDTLDSAADHLGLRRRLALKAFRHTASYDAAISTWLGAQVEGEAQPAELHLAATKLEDLRYGENPHQSAAVYRWVDAAEPAFTQLQGKALSYNNLVDLDAAWQMPWEFERPAVAIIKHTNPCGLAEADDLVTALERAIASDPVSAFGSIITTNRIIDLDWVIALAKSKLFVEVICAPGYTPEAAERLQRRKACRVMQPAVSPPAPAPVIRSIAGGLLVQGPDTAGADVSEWRCVTEAAPTEAQLADLAFAWKACKHVKSNAILFATDGATVGVGAGQMNRVDSARLAAWRAGDRAQGAVCASDAFFPFPDGVEACGEAGIRAIVQPGGSVRDDEVIAAANRLGIAMMFTGRRHFRH
ncbi:MAG: bifunctional phosphoribosylaminoimidazolecarboxamide formyltransferase/IMP cyclohydrolase [Alphaproteobacteria bacterium]|nr:bifunctional phosphoribosylaminoimidazolecarboxamide formyltransferase/IMP cyclohydrolase [Alphaproteobacteria bacterium]